MNVICYAQNTTPGNTHVGRLRESSRMASIAWCLHRLGHTVQLFPGGVLDKSGNRMKVFATLINTTVKQPDITMYPAEMIGHTKRRLTVAIKTSKKGHDWKFLDSCDILVAHEYDHEHNEKCPSVVGMPQMLPVPWFIHDKCVQYLADNNLLEAFLLNELEAIRSHFNASDKQRRVGFYGSPINGRRHMMQWMPDYVDLYWTNASTGENIGTAGEYLRWIAKCEAGLCLPGDTAKANRFCEWVMLGVALIMVRCPMRETPEVSEKNAILLEHYADIESLESGLNNLPQIIANADKAYREGWSPMGQTKQLLKKIDLITKLS